MRKFYWGIINHNMMTTGNQIIGHLFQQLNTEWFNEKRLMPYGQVLPFNKSHCLKSAYYNRRRIICNLYLV